MPDDVPKPVTGAVTYQSLLQYVLIALVGLLTYLQHESSKYSERVWDVLKEDRKESREDRKATWQVVVGNTKTMEQVLRELSDARKEQSGIKADVAKVQAMSEKAATAVGEVKKAVESKEP